MSIFFTSDEHYFHTNIIKYCKRPFADAEEMNNAMILSHNKFVKEDDVVYHMGDFTFRSPFTATKILQQLNGKHHFVSGNHDEWLHHADFESATDELFRSKKLLSVRDYNELRLGQNGQKIHLVMFHFPLLTWHKGHHGSIMLHGHTHGNVDAKNERDGVKRFDVGVDSAAKLFGEYRPFSLDEVLSLAESRVVNTLDFGGE